MGNKLYRVERTEQHTRVWFIWARSAEAAIEVHGEHEDNEEHARHFGPADITARELVPIAQPGPPAAAVRVPDPRRRRLTKKTA